MNRCVLMQVELEAGLRARFQAAVALAHRAVDQVLGRLMREYVAGGRIPVAVDDRDLDELVLHQHGWRPSPSGGD